LPAAVRVIELGSDDAWARDVGPTFVVNARGRVRGVDWVFNAWGGLDGGLYFPWDRDDQVARKILEVERLDRYRAPFVLEGGAIHVDGQGTLLTTEQCLLNPNRNPGMSREDIEAELARTLGIATVVWLPYGITADLVTDGHVDAVCAFVRPGAVLFQACDDPAHPDFDRMAANRRVLEATADAAGRALEIIDLPTLPEPADGLGVAYANIVLVNGGVILGVGGDPADDEALAVLRAAFPDREVVAVGGTVFSYAGGGPHCTTMQIPKGAA
jgi:agmatine deiminase